MDLDKVIEYTISLYDQESGLYRFSQNSSPTLLSADFALMVLFLCNKNAYPLKDDMINSLLKHKTWQNSFIDSSYDMSVERYHKPDYIINQFTFFTLITLDQLGYKFDRLPFYDDFMNNELLNNWLNTLQWERFWYESNKIMFAFYFLTYINEYGVESDRKKAKSAIECLFKVLDDRQDKNTGYWGTDLNNGDLVDGCLGAAHIYLFYDYFKREVQYPEKIIDSTLSLHTNNGLMLSLEGGACEDYDAVEIYMRMLKQVDYRTDEIFEVLENMRQTIASSQCSCGGFPYRIPAKLLGFIKINKNELYSYSSWEKMTTNIYKPDIWGTLFRILTLAAIDGITGKNVGLFQSYQLPGWGYLGFDPAKK